MASTGEKLPTSGTTTPEDPWLDNAWTSPGNVTANDTTYASVTAGTFDATDQTEVLKAFGFDFSAIPDGSTINGVTARVEARADSTSVLIDLAQLLDVSRAKVGTNLALAPSNDIPLTTSDAVYPIGGASNLWGNALTAAWVKDPDFGIAVGVRADIANSQVFVDYVTLEIDYTPPTSTDLVIANAAHAHTADNAALTQVHTLAIATTAQAQTADVTALTQVHVLAAAGSDQAQTVDNVNLTVGGGAADLVIANAEQAHTADNVALSQVHALAVANTEQAQTADNATLTQAHTLTTANAEQAQTADNVALTQVHTLAIDNASQAQTADNLEVDSATQLVIADTSHAHSVDGLALTQVHQLLVANAAQAHLADLLALTQAHTLVIADAAHAHSADNVAFAAPYVPMRYSFGGATTIASRIGGATIATGYQEST